MKLETLDTPLQLPYGSDCDKQWIFLKKNNQNSINIQQPFIDIRGLSLVKCLRGKYSVSGCKYNKIIIRIKFHVWIQIWQD